MSFKREDGYTGVDIAISIVVLFIFVSLIAMLSYHLNSSAQQIERKAEAVEIAVMEVEKLKNKTFQEIQLLETTQEQNPKPEEIVGKKGFYKTVTMEDYHKINSTKDSDLVKKITVTIQYRGKQGTEEVKLSTIVSKES